MKNTRRFIPAVMALAMVSAIAPMSAFAADDPTSIDQETALPTTKDINVSFENAPTYTVTIPADVSFGDRFDEKSNQVKVEDVYLGKGRSAVVVPVDSANGYKLALNGTDTETAFPYTVNTKVGEGAATTVTAEANEVIKVATGTSENKGSGTATLTYAIPENTDVPAPGRYSDTLTFTISLESAAPVNPYANNVVGDVVTFGIYDWYIIGKSDNGVTLLMKENLTTKAYNDDLTDTTWATCSLRAYLNGEFYNGSGFSDEDRAKIVKTSNTNPNNGSVSGGKDTKDYIYLLSIGEANALDNSIRANGSWWWLRSPGLDSYYAALVYDSGNVNSFGDGVDHEGGVRPVINLEF